LGIRTGIDLDKLVETGQWISSVLGREPVSKAGRAIAAKKKAAAA
jgi:hydroxymethylglutaryl-CoA lyase